MKKYYKDYKLVSRILQNGKLGQEIEYTGRHYICRLDKEELRKKKIYCLTLALCSDIALIGVGILNTSGSRVFYVALPYVCLFFPVVFCFMGAVRFITSGDRLEYAAYDRSVNRLRKSAVGQVILSGMAVAGDLCYLFFGKDREEILKEIIYLGGMALVLALGILLLRTRTAGIYEAREQNS
jgi:hypothetical protein